MRRLSVDDEYYIDSLNEFPPLLFTYQEIKDWAWTLCVIGMIYCIVGVAIVCNDYFVPAVEVLADKFQISEDIAGATWLAIGTSAPELFTCFIGTFVAQSDVGFGTIIGSAIFNVGLIVGSCAIFSAGDLKISWWSFARDMIYLLICLGLLALFFGGISKNEIHWWESLILLILYVFYVILMKYNEELKSWFFNKYIYTEKEKQLLAPKNDYGTNGTTHGATTMTASRSRATMDVIIPFETPEFNAQSPMIHFSEQQELDKMEKIDLPKVSISMTEPSIQIQPPPPPAISSPYHNQSNSAIQLQPPVLSLPYHNQSNSAISYQRQGRRKKFRSTTVSIRGAGGDYFIRELPNESFCEAGDACEGCEACKDSNCERESKEGVDLSFPQNRWKRISYIIQAPLTFSINFTCVDVTKEANESWWPWTFCVSIVWLGVLSYLMVWWCVCVGYAWSVPQELMGLVFLAGGTSLPELITCVIVAQKGKADMAIAGAVASNILNILVGLPLPWLTMSLITNLDGKLKGNGDIKIDVQADGLFWSILVLIAMMGVITLLIMKNKWTLTHCTGWTMITLYVVFVVQDLLRYYLLDIEL